MELQKLEEKTRKSFMKLHIKTNEAFPFDFIEKFCENHKQCGNRCSNTIKKTLKEYNYLRGKDVKSWKENTNRCFYFRISRSQRYHELKRGNGLGGTESFQVIGCYDCNGHDKNCEKYLSRNTL